jgi:hypothetical protein
MHSLTTHSSETLEFTTQQIRMLLTHPLFTGQCPQCRTRLTLQNSLLKQCRCTECGWNDLPAASEIV